MRSWASIGLASFVLAVVACGSRTGFDDGVGITDSRGGDAGVGSFDASIGGTSLACSPGDPPQVLLNDGQGIRQIAVSGDTVYFSEQPAGDSPTSPLSISSIPAVGGSRTSLGISGLLEFFATDGESIFWGMRGPAYTTNVSARSIGGGPTRQLVSNAGLEITALFVDADSLFISANDPNVLRSVVRVAKDGSSSIITQLDDGKRQLGPIVAIDPAAVYVFAFTSLVRLSKTGGATESAVLNFATGSVPWATGDATSVAYSKWSGGAGEVRVGPSSGHDDTLLAASSTKVTEVALDGDTVYWFDEFALRKASKSNPTVVTVVDGVSGPKGLIVGETCVYFQERGQIIKRAPK
jgi:hypothetical protein